MTGVTTVLGPIAPEQLGVTLMHEHLARRHTLVQGARGDRRTVAYQPVSIEVLGLLRHDPFMCRDNCELFDEVTATEEVRRFRLAGGDTVVDPTCRGIGRDPRALQRIARATGLQIVMGTGYYLHPAHPPHVRAMSLEAVAEEITRDVVDGVDGVRAGIIGEIGSLKISPPKKKRCCEAPLARNMPPACRSKCICPDGSATASACSTSWPKKAAICGGRCSAT